MTPRPIKPEEIRPGMRVERRYAEDGDVVIHQFTVRGVRDNTWATTGEYSSTSIDTGNPLGFWFDRNEPDDGCEWTLLEDAPDPDAALIERIRAQHGDSGHSFLTEDDARRILAVVRGAE